MLNTDALEHLVVDSHVTSVVLSTLAARSLAKLRYLYTEPSRDDGELFCSILERCPELHRLGFSPNTKSGPLEDAPFAQLQAKRMTAFDQLTHWTGPSNLVQYFNRKRTLRHVVLDQYIVADDSVDITTPYAELLHSRNLSTSPAVEATRIHAVQSLVEQESPLRTLDIVLSSSAGVKEAFSGSRVQAKLEHLRIKCMQLEGHTVSPLSKQKTCRRPNT
ncbi:hypothetical protein DL93DRAFT_2082567 [Clavulina sp. PMI_390]|nr:hypothetical protein DL93DRAFT_2082567 [Clavulina sp. PMI_390]